MNKWYQQSGTDGDVVISTRIRLARNLCDIAFPAGLNAGQKKEVAYKVRDALFADGNKKDFDFLQMDNMTSRDAMSMAERHLISPEFARCEEGGALLLSHDDSISIMINE